MNLLVWRCFENLVFIIKGKMRWSTEFRPANGRCWKERVVALRHGENRRGIRQTPIDIFISQPRVDSGKSPSIVAKGKMGYFSHTQSKRSGAPQDCWRQQRTSPALHQSHTSPREQGITSRVSHSQCATSTVQHVAVRSLWPAASVFWFPS